MIEIPGIEPKIRFKLPFYYRKTWVCYMHPIKGNAVELCFVRAKELDYSKNYLTFGKRVQVGGIMMTKPSEIDLPLISLIVEEALALDESTPYTFKKKKVKGITISVFVLTDETLLESIKDLRVVRG